MTVTLVIDDGPTDMTEAIIDWLDAAGVHAELYLVGDQVRDYATVVRRAAEAGHRVGNHSHTHVDLTSLRRADLVRELDQADEAIREVTGATPCAFRPPFVRCNDGVLDVARRRYSEIRLKSSIGDYDCDDPVDITIRASIAAMEGFIGIHDGHEPTLAALPSILKLVT